MIALFFATLAVAIIVGIPVGFSVAISALLFLVVDGFPLPGIVVQRMVSGVDSFPLLALPLFILAGNLMAYGTTERLMKLANALLGRVNGGLAMSGVAAATFFSSISGSGAATAAAVGTIVQPEMEKKGYDVGFSASVIAGAGSLGIIIPPSLPMVIFGVSASVSIGDLFLAGILPGILTALILVAYCWFMARRRGYGMTGEAPVRENFLRVLADATLPLLMPVIILGGILLGIFTPTEAAAVSCAYALLLSTVIYRRLGLADLWRVILNSAIGSAVILFVIAAATPFSWVMATERIPQAFNDLVLGLSANPSLVLFLMMALILILGTFMETIAIIVIMTPIFMSLVSDIGIHPLQFGTMFMLALAIGGATPPLSVNLFVTARIAGIPIERSFPFIIHIVLAMLLSLVIVWAIPFLSTWP